MPNKSRLRGILSAGHLIQKRADLRVIYLLVVSGGPLGWKARQFERGLFLAVPLVSSGLLGRAVECKSFPVTIVWI